jgi:hypothetical protein
MKKKNESLINHNIYKNMKNMKKKTQKGKAKPQNKTQEQKKY